MSQAPVLLALMFLLVSWTFSQPHFYPDDPLAFDNDQLDTPRKPAEIELSDLYDRFANIFHDFGDPQSTEAQNINTLGEVPDSSWFTNRHGLERMTISELIRGPNTDPAPDTSQTWTVFRSKTQGLTPGFQVVDPQGVRYVIKFDTKGSPELASGAEVISTKILHAIGYNVPQNFIVFIDPRNLEIKPGTQVTDEFGDSSELTPEVLTRILRGAARDSSGRLRALASKYIPGEVLGPFRYYGTRSDDPNDVILHENRRELRGLRLFAAWINHDDTRSQNTQDSWVAEEGKHYVRHYLIDFGSTLGSGTVGKQLRYLTYHYWLDTDFMLDSIPRFGLAVPRYRKVKWPRETSLVGVGNIESEFFDPEKWKNDYPNPAFTRMTARDAFWAARIISRFTRDELRAILEQALFTDRRATDYLLETLIARQRKCLETYLLAMNPLDKFQIQERKARFVNLAEEIGLSSRETRYRVRWLAFNNETSSQRELTGPAWQREASVELPPPDHLQKGEMLILEIASQHRDYPSWLGKISVYIRHTKGEFEIVGITR